MEANIEQKNPTTTGFDVKIEEETDTQHIYETVGYIAIESTVLRSGAAKVSETKYYPYGVVQEGDIKFILKRFQNLFM